MMTTGKATDIINAIKSAENILVCGHIRPDGDCIGSALAMRRICEKLGKHADAVCDDDKPETYAFLPDYSKFCTYGARSYDLCIAVDCADRKRLGDCAEYLDSAENTVDIDHHPANPGYGKINVVNPAASSTCSIIFDLFEPEGIIDRDIATMLYTGLSTDTGHFMHDNTDAHVFSIAAALCGYGLDIGGLNHSLYCSKGYNKMKLTARVIDSIKLYDDGRIALMTIMRADLDEFNCGNSDTEGLIDFATSISGVRISIAICEQPGNLFRVSLRSPTEDVSAVAMRFGGGGHKLAAGCLISGSRFDVTDKIVSACSFALK